MCILPCFGPTPPRVTISCHPKFGAAELRIRAQPKPDIPGPTLRMWGNSNGPGIPSERTGQIQRPLPLIAAFQSASRGCPSRIPGAWGPLRRPTARRGPATAFLATGRPGYGSLLASDFLAQRRWRSSRRRRRRLCGRTRRRRSPRRSTSGPEKRRAASSARGHHHHRRGRARRRPSTCPSMMMMRTRRRPCRSRTACTSTGATSSGCG